MPVYNFDCKDCGNTREIIVSHAQAEQLELMCYNCGGDMTRAPVMTLNVIGPALRAKKNEKQQEERAFFAKACGHNYACRCGVKLNKENPFKQDIRAAHGFTDEI